MKNVCAKSHVCIMNSRIVIKESVAVTPKVNILQIVCIVFMYGETHGNIYCEITKVGVRGLCVLDICVCYPYLSVI